MRCTGCDTDGHTTLYGEAGYSDCGQWVVTIAHDEHLCAECEAPRRRLKPSRTEQRRQAADLRAARREGML